MTSSAPNKRQMATALQESGAGVPSPAARKADWSTWGSQRRDVEARSIGPTRGGETDYLWNIHCHESNRLVPRAEAWFARNIFGGATGIENEYVHPRFNSVICHYMDLIRSRVPQSPVRELEHPVIKKDSCTPVRHGMLKSQFTPWECQCVRETQTEFQGLFVAGTT